MKNLYKIIVLHGAPKDTHTSIETFLVTKDDFQVMIWIDENKYNGYWKYCGEDGEMRCQEESPYNEITMRDYVLQNCGDLKDDAGWEDAYYGVTKFGWKKLDASEEDIKTLIRLGIAEEA